MGEGRGFSGRRSRGRGRGKGGWGREIGSGEGGGGGGGGEEIAGGERRRTERGGRRDREGKKESSLWVYKCDRENNGLWPANGDGGRSNEFFPSSSSLKFVI